MVQAVPRGRTPHAKGEVVGELHSGDPPYAAVNKTRVVDLTELLAETRTNDPG